MARYHGSGNFGAGEYANQVSIIYEGQARLLGYDPQTPVTLKLLRPGEVLGWAGLVRGVPCETAIASTVVCLSIPAEFSELLEQNSS